jgi:hypothetical protein
MARALVKALPWRRMDPPAPFYLITVASEGLSLHGAHAAGETRTSCEKLASAGNLFYICRPTEAADRRQMWLG